MFMRQAIHLPIPRLCSDSQGSKEIRGVAMSIVQSKYVVLSRVLLDVQGELRRLKAEIRGMRDEE